MATDLTTETTELTPELLRQVRALSAAGREELGIFLAELDAPPPPGPDWEEIKRRLESIRDGTAVFVDPAETFARIREKLREKGLL